MDRSSKNNACIFIRENAFWLILFLAGIVCMWLTQRRVPVMMDDEWYSTVLSSDRQLASFGDIVRAQVWHYYNWGGRTVAHTIAQLIFLYLSPTAADVLNVALIVLLSWMLCAVSGERRFAFVTLTIGFLHGLNANWKMSMYWQTGACNYLYTMVLIMAFLWMYLRTLDGTEKAVKTVPGITLWASLLGLLSGWTNENMGPAVWVMTVLVMLRLKSDKKPVKVWMLSGSVCCLLGSAFMILAPGNSVRSAEVVSSSYGVLWQTFLRMYGVCKGAWEFLFPAILFTAAAVFVNVWILGNKLDPREAVLLAGAALSWGAMVLSPHYPDRAAFGTLCLLICVCVSQAAAILKTCDSRGCKLAMAGIGVFVWFRGMYFLGEFLSICWGWIR